MCRGVRGDGGPGGSSGAVRGHVGGGETGVMLKMGMASAGRVVGVSGGSPSGMGSFGILILVLIWSGDGVEFGTRIPGSGIGIGAGTGNGTGTGIGSGGGAWGVRGVVVARASVSGWSWLGLF